MAQSSEIKLNKRFDQNIEVTGTIKIGVREQTTAGDYISNKLTLIPPYHTGGPFNIRTRDDASSAFISIAYGSNEVATIKHDGTMTIGSNTVIHAGNIGSYALTSYSETSTLDSVADRGRTTNQQLISTNPAGFRVDSGSHARIELDSTDNWSYVRLQDQGVTTWDIACYNSGNLEWRPGGGEANRMTLSQSGYLTINGSMKVVGGVIDMNNNDGFVYDDGSNIMYVKLDGTNREIIHSANISSYALTSLPSHSHQQLSGFANQTEYDVISVGLNGLRMKARWDSATANRYWDMGYVDGFGTFYSGLKVYNNGDLTYKGNTIIDSGNIGSQSVNYANSAGIASNAINASNADSLGGLGAAGYMRDDGWNSYPGQDADTQTAMRSDFSYSNNAPHTGDLIRFGASQYSLQLSSQYGGSGQGFSFRTRNGDVGSWNPWYQLIHSGNIGSQSVNYANNAGTLDGIDSSSFLRSDANDTMNGVLTMNAALQMNNYNIEGVNHLKFNDTGAGEGIEWVGGNGWKIYESGNNLDNTSGNLQFVTGSTRRMTLNTSGILEVFGDRIELNGKYVRDFPNYRWISGGGSYYSGGTSGWTKIAEVTIAGNCSGNVMYGRLYMRNYHEVQIYDIAVVTRGECDFTSNNESHFIELGCTGVAGSQFVDYKDHIRAVLVQSSTNLRKYEIQFFETAWNDNWWELFTSGFTIYETPQAPGSSTGTPRINYQSKMSADTVWADDAMYAPAFYDRNDTNYYVNPRSNSRMSGLRLDGVDNNASGDDGILWVNKPNGADWGILVSGNQDYGLDLRVATNNSYAFRVLGANGVEQARINSDYLYHHSDIRTPIYYDSDDTTFYCDPAGTTYLNNLTVANTVQARVKSLANIGYGDSDLTYYQSSSAWGGAPAGWHSHIVCNHGNGSNYYNQIIHMPFWGPPTYSRLEGGTQRANYSFWTSERTIISEHDITGPMFYVRPASNGAGAKINFSDHAGGSYAQNGTLEYVHSDTASYGSGNAFKFYGTETSMSFHVAGKGLFTGDVVAYYSDMRLKTKIGDIQDPIGKIKALNGFYYEPNEKALEYGYEKERRIGLSAQEVQEVVPEAVTMAAIGDNYLSVDYAKLVPVLVEAIKELSNKVEELENKLNGTEL